MRGIASSSETPPRSVSGTCGVCRSRRGGPVGAERADRRDRQPRRGAVQGGARGIPEGPGEGRRRGDVPGPPAQGDPARARAALNQTRQQGADVVFAIGSLAAQTAGRGLPETPIVAGLVLNADDLGGAGNATGVFLELPAETEFVWLKRFLPGQKNVGVLHSRARSPVWIRAAAQAAKAAGLTLHARSVESPTEIPDALESLGSRADVLWGVPDSVVITPQTAKPILLFSLRNRIPFVGLSRSWVRAGALYALDRDYADIGGAVRRNGGQDPAGNARLRHPPEPARKVVYAVNLKTARHMKLNIPEPLVRGAVEIVE